MLKVLILVVVLAVPIFGDDVSDQDNMAAYKDAFEMYANCGTDADYNKTIDELQKIFPNFTLAANSTSYDVYFTIAANSNYNYSSVRKNEMINRTMSRCKEIHDSFKCKVMLLPDYVECFITQQNETRQCLSTSIYKIDDMKSFCESIITIRECLQPILNECKSRQPNSTVLKGNFEIQNFCKADRSANASNLCEVKSSNGLAQNETVTTPETTLLVTDENSKKLPTSATKGPATVNKDDNGNSSITSTPVSSTINNDFNGKSTLNTTIARTPTANSSEGSIASGTSVLSNLNVYLLVCVVAMFINFSFN